MKVNWMDVQPDYSVESDSSLLIFTEWILQISKKLHYNIHILLQEWQVHNTEEEKNTKPFFMC